MKEDFFIQLIRINDNIGTVWEEGSIPKTPVLRVGDDYEIVVEANDPKDREIEYEIFTLGDFKLTQKSNRFNFTIENKLVSETTQFYVIARTPSSKYKNSATEIISVTILPE